MALTVLKAMLRLSVPINGRGDESAISLSPQTCKESATQLSYDRRPPPSFPPFPLQSSIPNTVL